MISVARLTSIILAWVLAVQCAFAQAPGLAPPGTVLAAPSGASRPSPGKWRALGFPDLGGNIGTNQMNGGSGANGSSFWRGDGTWAIPPGTGGGTSTANVQDFIAGTNFTAGTSTSLVLSSTPATAAALTISFDGVRQSADTWSLTGSTVTFNAAIPANITVVEAAWFSAAVTGNDVSSLGGAQGAIGTTSPLSINGTNLQLGFSSPLAVSGGNLGLNVASPLAIGGGNLTLNTIPLSLGGLGGSQASATANQIPVYPGTGGAAVPTGFASLLNALCSSSIGQYWVRLSGGWGCTILGWVNPVWWGADPTGVADSTSAFNSALAATFNSANATVRFPPGTFRLLSPISFTYPASNPWSQTIEGAGAGATTLLFPNGSGISLSMSSVQHSARLAHLRIATSQANTGTGLAISNSACLGMFAMSTFQDLMINGDDNGNAHYWNTGASVNGVSGTTWFDDTFYGLNNINGGGTGLKFSSPATCGSNPASSIYHYVVMVTLNNLNTAISYGNGTQGVFIETINAQNDTNGIVVPAGATGALDELSVINSQITVSNIPIDIEQTIGIVTFAGNLLTPGSGQAAIKANATNLNSGVVSGNIIICTSAGFGLYTKGNFWSITGNYISSCANSVEIDSVGQFNNVVGNVLIGATNGVLVNGNSSTAQFNLIADNIISATAASVGLTSTAKQNYVWGNVSTVGVNDNGANDVVGQTCSGTPSSSFASTLGIVTHC